jgi:hypothetical protein
MSNFVRSGSVIGPYASHDKCVDRFSERKVAVITRTEVMFQWRNCYPTDTNNQGFDDKILFSPNIGSS